MNDGGALIANLAGDACVEVPALVDGLGVHPDPDRRPAAAAAPRTRVPPSTARSSPFAPPSTRTATSSTTPCMTDPIVQARLTLDEAWRMTDELIAAEGEWLPGWLGGTAPDWTDVHDRRRPPMLATPPPRAVAAPRSSPRSWRSSSRPAAARPRPRRRPASAPSAAAPASAAPAGSHRDRRVRGRQPGRLHRPARRRSVLDLGRPAGDHEPAGDRRRLPRGQPEHHGQSGRVADWDAYWAKLQTGLAGGDAPDVFAMDGPLFPDYQTRDVLLDLKPYIDKDGLRPHASSPTTPSRTSRPPTAASTACRAT